MVTKEQAMIGQWFVRIDSEGKCTHHYSRRYKSDKPQPAMYRGGKCYTFKRDSRRWKMVVTFGQMRQARSYQLTDTDNDTHELSERYEARQRYGFRLDTPNEVIADRCRDDGDDASADMILGIPRVYAVPIGSQPGM